MIMIWYMLYTFIIFFLSVNIFLAIIVEAFLEVKHKVTEEWVTERSILMDIIGLVRRWSRAKVYGWPSHLQLARHLHMTRHLKGPVTSSELLRSKYLKMGSAHDARFLMDFYFRHVGENLLAEQGRQWLAKLREQEELHLALVEIFGYDIDELHLLEHSARRLQARWRKQKATKANVEEPLHPSSSEYGLSL